MKKLLCVLLTLSLILCAAALAEGTYNQNNSTASTTLTTTIVDPSQPVPTYTLIIPSTLEITPNATSTTLTVQLTEANNANSIRVETAANGSMTNGSGGTIEFTVTSNELTFSNFANLPATKTGGKALFL